MKRVFVKIFLICLFFSTALGGENLPATLKSGLNELYNLRYESAIRIADSVILEYPKHPGGYLLKSLVYFYQIGLGKREKGLKDEFLKCNNLALDVAKRHENKMEALFFRAAALSNIALFYGMESEWFSAVRFGLQARSEHEKVVKYDPTFYDSYICLGLFNYYADTLPGILDIFTGLFGIKGDSRIGIDQLKLTYEKGTYLNVEAATFLHTFYMERGNFEAALAISSRLVKSYPGNPYFLLDKAKTYYELANYPAARAIFERLVSDSAGYAENAAFFSYYYLGRIYMLYNRYDKADADFKEVIRIGKNSDLIQLYDGWLIGDGYYFTGECFEFLGQPDSALTYYKLAKDARYVSKGIEQASRNRLNSLCTDYELDLQRLIHIVSRGDYRQGYERLSVFWDTTKTNPEAVRFKTYIFYHLGQAQFEIGNMQKAKDFFKTVLQESTQAGYFDWIIPHTELYLAKYYYNKNDPENARSFLNQAISCRKYNNENRLRFLIEKYEKLLYNNNR